MVRKNDTIKKLKTDLLRGSGRAAEFWLNILDDEDAKPELRMKAAEQLMSYGVGKGTLLQTERERPAGGLRLSLSERLAAAEEEK
ncbi:MAG: hypothetical protein IJU78_09355 [Clostridia bacterium]|nr:hypothetical protein [Clostridia bacterium]